MSAIREYLVEVFEKGWKPNPDETPRARLVGAILAVILGPVSIVIAYLSLLILSERYDTPPEFCWLTCVAPWVAALSFALGVKAFISARYHTTPAPWVGTIALGIGILAGIAMVIFALLLLLIAAIS